MIKYIAHLIVSLLSFSSFATCLQAGAPSPSPQSQVPAQEEEFDDDDDEDDDVIILEEDVDDEYYTETT